MARKKYEKKEKGVYQGHCSCPLEIKKGVPCGSSDAGSFYLHEDSSYSFSCFSCGGSAADFDPETAEIVDSGKRREINWEEEQEKLEDVRDGLISVDNPDRKLRAATYEFYGCRMETTSDGEKIEAIYYPSYRAGEHKGYRNRKRFQSWHSQVKKKPELLGVLKDFTGGIGDTQKGIDMFGSWLFPSGGKRIIINCGEEDAMTVWKLTEMKTKFDGGYPSISCPSGENIAWVKPHINYLSSFSDIYIIADQDKAGAKFEGDLCKILPVGKVRLVRLPKGYKDPSAMLQKIGPAKAAEILWRAIWDAQKYSPVGIKTLSEVWENYKDLGDEVLIPLPACFGSLQNDTGGLELGGVHGVVASTSVGKTAFVGEILYNARLETQYNIGVCSAEDTVEEYLRALISLHISKPLREYSKSERNLEEEHEAMVFLQGEEGNRFSLLEHAGTADLDELLEKVEWLITAQDCKLIALDPVTLLVGSESSSLDEFMSSILKLAKRHMVAFLLVFHTRKTQSGAAAASQGAEVTIEDIKSSGSGGQVCASIMLLGRNKEHENDTVRNTTTIRWGKFRRKGSVTGQRDYVFYEKETGRLHLGSNPKDILDPESGNDVPLNSHGAGEFGGGDQW